MANQAPYRNNSNDASLLAADGETDLLTRRIHARTRGAVNATVVEIVDASGNQITTFGAAFAPYTTTGNAPAVVSVGVASGALVPSNASRKGVIITNASVNNVSLHFAGGTAVLNSGLTLYPGQSFVMDNFTFTTSAITAIASAAASNVGYSEFQ